MEQEFAASGHESKIKAQLLLPVDHLVQSDQDHHGDQQDPTHNIQPFCFNLILKNAPYLI